MSKDMSRIVTGTTDVKVTEVSAFMRAQGQYLVALGEKAKGRQIAKQDLVPQAAKGATWRFLSGGIKASFSSFRGDHRPGDKLLLEGAALVDAFVAKHREKMGDWACELALPAELKTARMKQVAMQLGAKDTAALIDRTLAPDAPKP